MTKEDFYNIINGDGNNEIKAWLAKSGGERIDEMFDSEITFVGEINCWRMQGYSEK